MTRDQSVSSFRTAFFGTTKIDMTEIEFFQNTVLRPILKFQNDIFLILFREYLKQFSKDFSNIKLEQKLLFVQHTFQKDIKFRTSNIGLVLALMTVEEIETYLKNKSEYNRRIATMLSERIIDQIQFFD